MYQQLLSQLGLTFDPETTTYTIPEEISVEQALAQYDVCSELDWTEADINTILGFLYAVDLLNKKYLTVYDLETVEPTMVAGLEVAYKRAVGSIVYGFLNELYKLYGMRPKVFQAIFGPKLGRLLFDHSLKMKEPYERFSRVREQYKIAPGSFEQILREELTDINLEQKQLAILLGLPEKAADRAARHLFDDHFHGTIVDFESIENELSVSSGETAKRRIQEGEEIFPSEDYTIADKLAAVEDKEKRKKLLKAIQTAKDKDRANAGRLKDQVNKSGNITGG